MNTDDSFMARALRLAMQGRGAVEPNPMVGCVIARGGEILGEGFHRRFGHAHAEIEALRACQSSPAGATAFVTLEPCCHLEKKTPPCAAALLEARLARVVIGCIDPNPKVSGRGAAQLRAGGIEVNVGLREAEARQLLAPFIATTSLGRPYVTLKWAQSADAKVAGAGGRRMRISGEQALRAVHRLRGACDAILVGIGTVLLDDPLLTSRGVEHPRALLRVVLDTHLRVSENSQLIRTARHSPVLVYCGAKRLSDEGGRAGRLEKAGATLVGLDAAPDGRLPLDEILRDLHARAVTHLLVEGGPTVARQFIAQNLADRAWVFRSAMRIDASSAPDAPELHWPAAAEANVGQDRLVELLNPASSAFAALFPSADFARFIAPAGAAAAP